jgi:hypothetical protein
MKRRIHLPFLISVVAVLFVLGAGVLKGHTGGGGGGGRLTVPEAWRGTWEVTVTYTDRETGALVATDVTTGAICPGEPIMPPLLDTSLHCSGEAAKNKLGVLCSAKHSPRPGSNIFVGAALASRRDGDDWRGTGLWAVKRVGRGEHLNYSEDIVVTGKRMSREAACDGERLSLVQRFFAHSELVPFLGGRN